MAQVGIVMGSDSDMPVMAKAADILDQLGVSYEMTIISAIGNVRFTEVDTPRVRAAMIYGLRTGTNSFEDEDFVDALYRSDLSACCRRNCVNG